jgi:hypothetical protein
LLACSPYIFATQLPGPGLATLVLCYSDVFISHCIVTRNRRVGQLWLRRQDSFPCGVLAIPSPQANINSISSQQGATYTTVS